MSTLPRTPERRSTYRAAGNLGGTGMRSPHTTSRRRRGLSAGLWLLHILLYPGSLLMPAMFNFSLGALALAFGVFGGCSSVLGHRDAPDMTSGPNTLQWRG